MWLPKAGKQKKLWVPRLWLPFAYKPWRFNPCSSCCAGAKSCDYCTSGTTPSQYSVVIDNIADDSCGVCELYNDTYVLQQYDYGVTCSWEYEFDAHCHDGSDAMQLYLTAVGIEVHLSIEEGTILWKKSLSNPRDCGFSGLSVPLDYEDATLCDASAATCEVTAL